MTKDHSGNIYGINSGHSCPVGCFLKAFIFVGYGEKVLGPRGCFCCRTSGGLEKLGKIPAATILPVCYPVLMTHPLPEGCEFASLLTFEKRASCLACSRARDRVQPECWGSSRRKVMDGWVDG